MRLVGPGKRVRFYVGETDHWRDQPLYLAILEALRAEGCAGATATRALAGFGGGGVIHTATLLDVSENLPIVVEWVDSPERIERVLPKILPLLASGLVTVDDTTIAYQRHRSVADLWAGARVREVMSRAVVTARPDQPLAEAARLLVESPGRALPVVDSGGRVVGILTNADLVERGGLGLRVEMLRTLDPESLGASLAGEPNRTVADAMTRDVVTVSPNMTLGDIAHLMDGRRLKRLPVVSESGRLLGMVSRVDLLRTRADFPAAPEPESPARRGRTIGEVMRRDVPTVRPDAPLAEVLDVVVGTRLGRALVVDEDGRVIGLVSDAELVRRLSPRDHPGVARLLVGRLPFASLGPAERRELERATATTAGQLMDREITTVTAETPLGEAIGAMLREKRKILSVVDDSGRLIGAVDRADLLRALVEPATNPEGDG
jgi:CBS domain-containing protein